jgi:hypothetical protein
MAADYRELAGYRRCVAQATSRWPDFLKLRQEMFAQQARFDRAPEKVAENIVGSLFTSVLDWSDHDLNWQLGRADLVVTRNFVKYLVVETKSPGSLKSRKSLDAALEQAWRYADEQRVRQVAVCDGLLFYGADIDGGGLKPRVYFDLTQERAPHDSLWWISVDGIYRPCESPPDVSAYPGRSGELDEQSPSSSGQSILHPKYQIPARCFAYVGDPGKPATWKLPYLLADGNADLKRLPKAIQALASNYRGAKVGGIPEPAIPEVFRRLAEAASAAGKMPAPGIDVAAAYQHLAEILKQLEAAGK